MVKQIAVHDGPFHADEIFSVAILKLIFNDIEIIRTRDSEIYSKVDLRVDVGMKCDPKKGDFDHHQRGGAGERYNGIPYSSAGLVWNEFGRELVDTEEEWELIDKKIIQPIDAGDNGYNYYFYEKIRPYVINSIIGAFSPSWDSDESYRERFDYVLNFVVELLKSEIQLAKGFTKAQIVVREAMQKYRGKEFMVLNFYCPWKRLVQEESDFKFVVLKGYDDSWNVHAVPDGISEYSVRKDLPVEWAGLEGKELQDVSGIKDAIFCHKNLFIAGAKTKEGAFAMVKKALEESF